MEQRRVAILKAYKIEFHPKFIKRGREGQLILIKGKIHPDDILILNNFGPNTRVPTFVKETLAKLKANIKAHTTVGDFNNSLLPNDR